MKPIIVCDEDDVCSDRMLPLVHLLNEVTGQHLEPDDIRDPRLWVSYGISRDEMIRIRQEVEPVMDIARFAAVAGMQEAYDQLSSRFSFVIGTARVDEELEATQKWHSQHGHDVTVVLCACPDPNCGSSRCVGRESKLDLALRLGAHAFIDDHPGEFLSEGRIGAWGNTLTLCFRQPWNHSCDGTIPRLNWPEIAEFLLS